MTIDRAADAAARREALAPERSFIVQAPAGSGKTELLTQRYLRLLALAETPEQVLAITFTRKAAGEMRDRVLRALAAAGGEAPAEPHRALTWELARAVAERDGTFNWRLADYPARLRIDTIDAFAGGLTRRLPVTAAFGVAPRIAERPAELYADAARRTLAMLDGRGDEAGWSVAVATLLEHLDNDVQQLERLLVSMLAKRDQWLRPVGPGQERAALEAALAREVCSQLEALAACAPAALAADIVVLAQAAAANLAAAGVDEAQCHCAGLEALPGAAVEDAAAWRGIAAMLLTKSGGWRKKLTKKEGFPSDQADLKARGMDMLRRLEDETDFGARLAATRTLPPLDYTDDQWAVLQALLDLLKLAAAQLQLVFAERGSVDFIEMALRALRALGEPEAPTDLALALDDKLQHILVDEFQDTSWSQYALIERLTAGWMPGDGRTLFLVGDPMQSIYRFREAEVGLYLRARREGIGSVRLEPLALGINFRSTGTVVDWINATFAGLFPAAEDLAAGAVPYASALARDGAPADGGVEIVARFDGDAADEAARIAALVAERRRADPDESIAILARSRSHVAATLAALRAAGLAAQAVEVETLAGRPAVQDLYALTRALVHPGDRVAWLAVLRAPWCGLTLADMTALVGDDRERCVWDLLQNLERLSADGRARAARLVDALGPVLARRRRVLLRRLVEGAWLVLGGPACVEDAVDLDNAEAYFALVEALSEAGEIDVDRLAERLDELYARPSRDADERLQVMTIHKAKGLEFDSVILPALERQPRADSRQLLLWLERPRPKSRPDFLLAPITAAGEDGDRLYDSLKTLARQQDEMEQLRLLYVATTRARKRLYLFGSVRTDDEQKPCPPPAASLLAKLWPRLDEHFDAVAAAESGPEAQRPTTSSPGAIRRLSVDWRLPPPQALDWRTDAAVHDTASVASVEFSWAGETARHVGVLVHALLDRIARDGIGAWTPARIDALAPRLEWRLRWLGVPEPELERARDRVIDAIASTLADERGRWLLAADHVDERSEYALSGIVAGRRIDGVIDRTFVADGTRWIVDYKTSRHEGGRLDEFLARERDRYRGQLETYAQLFAAREQRPQRLGLYFPLLGGWIEWEPCG